MPTLRTSNFARKIKYSNVGIHKTVAPNDEQNQARSQSLQWRQIVLRHLSTPIYAHDYTNQRRTTRYAHQRGLCSERMEAGRQREDVFSKQTCSQLAE